MTASDHLSGQQFDMPIDRHFDSSDYGEGAIHPRDLHEDFHDMEDDDYDRLVDDVAENGVKKPVQMEQHVLVDGHHRVAAAWAAGHKTVPAVQVEGVLRERQMR